MESGAGGGVPRRGLAKAIVLHSFNAVPTPALRPRFLEQFHFEIALLTRRRQPPRRPTRRAARRAVPVAQRAYRHREQRGVDSGENNAFRQNANFEIRKISKVIRSRNAADSAYTGPWRRPLFWSSARPPPRFWRPAPRRPRRRCPDGWWPPARLFSPGRVR